MQLQPAVPVLVVSDSVTLRTASRQAPLSIGFSGQGYWNRLPFSLHSFWPRDGTHISCIAGGSFTRWAIREALIFSLGYPKQGYPETFYQQPKSLLQGLTDLINVYWRGVVDHTLSQVPGTQNKNIFIPAFKELTDKRAHNDDGQLSIL